MDTPTTHPNRRAALLAGLIPVLLLIPFANKAWNIDDTVYLRVAEQILHNPLDFYGFQMNWQREPQWVYDFNQNPPGISYYIAAVAAVFGFNEIPLHVSFLVPTFLAGLGAYRLALRFTDRPLFAALAGSLTPAFLVSNSNIMCEPFVAAFYTWALALWVEGTDEASRRKLALGALCAGLGILAKYIVLTALPLMAAYTILNRSARKSGLAWLAIPVAILAAYDAYAYARYGVSLVLGAAGFASARGASTGGLVPRLAIDLAFLGGGFISAFFVLLTSAHRRGLTAFAGLFIVMAVGIVGAGGLDTAYRMYDGAGIRWGYVAQLALFIATGLLILGLAVKQAADRDAKSIVLLLWIAGIFLFAGFVNWTVNARAMLPAAPAVGIVLARTLPARAGGRLRGGSPNSALRMAALVSLLVLIADQHYANGQRRAARQTTEAVERYVAEGRLPDVPRNHWFQGHWGFQYYMEEAGYTHVSLAGFDIENAAVQTGLGNVGLARHDVCVVKLDDWMVDLSLGDDAEALLTVLSPPGFLTRAGTMNAALGAGFYDIRYGELPYCFGYAPPVEYTVYYILRADP